jgi:hypothetical protein
MFIQISQFWPAHVILDPSRADGSSFCVVVSLGLILILPIARTYSVFSFHMKFSFALHGLSWEVIVLPMLSAQSVTIYAFLQL